MHLQGFWDDVLIWNIVSNFYSWYNRNKTGKGDQNHWFLENLAFSLICLFCLFFLPLLWFSIFPSASCASLYGKCCFPSILSHPCFILRLLSLFLLDFRANHLKRVAYFTVSNSSLSIHFLIDHNLSAVSSQYFNESTLSELCVVSISDIFACIISLEHSVKTVVCIFSETGLSPIPL